MKITTAIFDLDGTLLNTLGDLCDSVTYAVEKHGFPPVSMEQTRIRMRALFRCSKRSRRTA